VPAIRLIHLPDDDNGIDQTLHEEIDNELLERHCRIDIGEGRQVGKQKLDCREFAHGEPFQSIAQEGPGLLIRAAQQGVHRFSDAHSSSPVRDYAKCHCAVWGCRLVPVGGDAIDRIGRSPRRSRPTTIRGTCHLPCWTGVFGNSENGALLVSGGEAGYEIGVASPAVPVGIGCGVGACV